MKNCFTSFIFISLVFLSLNISAQVGIRTDISGSSSAMLDVFSTDQGLLIPRLSTTQRNMIPTPAPGLMIYNTTTGRFNYYTGNAWYQIETTFVSDIIGTVQQGGGVSVSSIPDKPADLSAVLDVNDDIRGVLIPRTSPGLIPAPANGLIIYDISGNLLKYFFDNEWHTLCGISTGHPGLPGSQANIGVAVNKTGEQAHHSAILDVSAPDKGVLIPRLTTAQRNLVFPVTGLTIFNTTSKTIEYYDGLYWYRLNIILPASVVIGANQTAVCTGGTVMLTASPYNGGDTPAYQWKVNAAPVNGATNPTYSYVPANGDIVTCTMTSSSNCVTGSPATSNPITITVTPFFPAGIMVSPSANPVCAGSGVLFSTTIVYGGASPQYQWKVNGLNVPDATNATYNHFPAHNDNISCTLISSEACATNNPATSNILTMTVYPISPVSLTIAPSANPVCAGTQVTYTASPVNGGSSPQYQWRLNGNPISGATNASYAYVPLNNQSITCSVTSSLQCTSGNPATSGAVIMFVNPLLPVSTTIAPSANPVCAGTSVTYTSNVVNGGTFPQYQWKVNGNNISNATNATFTHVPVNNNLVTCVVTSNAVCPTGNPATSNAVNMTVNPLLTVSTTIAPSANPVCAGTSVTYTSNVVNGGTLPQYQWKVNGNNISNATNATFTHVPVNNNLVTCVVTSNAVCPTGNPATSNAVNMTVNPLLPVSLTIAPSGNPVCAGTSVTYTSTVVNGGTLPQYQWKVNGNNVSNATNATYTYIPSHNNSVTCVVTSNAICPTGSPATSNAVNMTVNPLLPVSTTISPSANPVCAGTSVTYTSNVVNGGTLPQYQWRVNGNNISNATNATFTHVPVNSNLVTCVVTSNAVCPTGNPATSNAVNMTVNPLLPVSISITESANTVCAGTSVSYTSTVVNGGTLPLYQWRVNGNNQSNATNATFAYVPVNNNIVSCVVTSNAVCPTGTPATSNPIAMTVNPLLPVSISIAPSQNPVCAGTSVTYTSTVVNGGTLPQYQWKVNGNNVSDATNATYTYIPAHNNSVTCVVTSNAICPTGSPATSNAVNMTVNPLLPVSMTIAPSSNPVCAGTSVTYTSNVVNGGTLPQYQWKVNGNNAGNATNATFTYTPAHNDAVTCEVTSNAICPTGNPATSNAVNMTVNPLLPVSISITESENTVCAGTLVSYTSAVVNGGTLPLYQWKLNGNNQSNATNATFAYVPVNNDIVSCVVTSNAVCPTGTPATSNPIAMTVNPLLPVSVTIAESQNTVCAGTSVAYSTSVVNGGTSPQYQWKINAVNASNATSSTFTYNPVHGDVVTCEVTSNAICPIGNPALSNAIGMIVNPLLPVSITATPTGNPVCAGTSVTYSSSVVNGGALPQYQWKVNAVNANNATNSTFTYVPVHGDLVTCEVLSNAICPVGNPALSNAVDMTVNPLLPVSITVAPSINPVCAGSSVTYTSTVVNGGTLPQYQWMVNAVNASNATNATYTYAPVHGDLITCMVTSNAICPIGNPATSNTVDMTVNPLLPVSINITSSVNNICAGTSATYNSTIVNGGTSPGYQWRVNGNPASGATNSSFTYIPAHNDAVTCVVTSNAICPINNPATSNVVNMIVNPLLPVSITATPSANPICPGTSVVFSASTVNGGTSPTYQWSVNGMLITGATSTSYSYTVTNNDLITCVLTSNAICAINTPATSNTVAMNVTPFAPVGVTIVASTPIVSGNPVTFTATPVNGGTAPVYQWKVNGVVVGPTGPVYSYIPAGNDLVQAVVTSNASCAIGSPAASNIVRINPTPLQPVSVTIAVSANSICAGSNVLLTATVLNGGTTPAYQWRLNGTNIAGATSVTYSFVPVNLNTITCVVTPAGGTAVTSNSITMSVIPLVPVKVSIVASLYALMPGNPVTYNASVENQGTVPVYQWKVNGVNSGTNSPVFTYTPADHDKVTCVLTSNYTATCLSGNPATSNQITMVVYMTGSPCAGVPTVTYAGKTYNTVQINTQCWLRENLDVGTQMSGFNDQTNNSVVEKYCSDNDVMNCNVYGGLYQWAEAVQYLNNASNSANWNPVPSGNVQGICPPGWHLPSNAEWGTLMTSQGGQTVAGGKIKEATLAHFINPNSGATNVSGFTALPAGQRWTTGEFKYRTQSTNYWTRTTGANPATDVYYGGATYSTPAATNGQFYKTTGATVRCLKD